MRSKMYFLQKFFWMLVFTSLLSQNQLQADKEFHFDFSKDHAGWIGDFADYPVGEEAFYELNWGWTSLPYPLPGSHQGMVLSGNNHSDDLLMFLKRQAKGLEPNTEYSIGFNVTIESNIPVGQMGIGGSPGESVYFKVGASTQEPVKQIVEDYYRISIDIGSQSMGGSNGIVIGDLANPAVDDENPLYLPKEMHTNQDLKVKSDEKGRLWLFVGTDSGFEGFTLYYIANIAVSLKKVE